MLPAPGAFAIYLEPWHADIFEWLDLRKNHGKEEVRARDLFYGLWVNDLFMKRVEENGKWSLFCPNEAQGLAEVWGEKFEEMYIGYEKEVRQPHIIRTHAPLFRPKIKEPGYGVAGLPFDSLTPKFYIYRDKVKPCMRRSICAPALQHRLPPDSCHPLRRARPRRWWKLKSCGLPFLRLRLRRETHTCCTRYVPL